MSVVLANDSCGAWSPLDCYLLLLLPTKKRQWQQQCNILPMCFSLGKEELCFWVWRLVRSLHPAHAWHLTHYCQSGVSLHLLGHLVSVYVYITAPWPWLFPYRPLTQQPKACDLTYYEPAPLRLSALYPAWRKLFCWATCSNKCLEHISFWRSNTFYEFLFLFF